MEDFRDMKVWKKAIELTKDIYGVTELFPEDEQQILAAEVKRSSQFIPANIAKAAGTTFQMDGITFVDEALATCYELETQIFLAYEVKYIPTTAYMKITKAITEVKSMIISLIKKMKLSYGDDPAN